MPSFTACLSPAAGLFLQHARMGTFKRLGQTAGGYSHSHPRGKSLPLGYAVPVHWMCLSRLCPASFQRACTQGIREPFQAHLRCHLGFSAPWCCSAKSAAVKRSSPSQKGPVPNISKCVFNCMCRRNKSISAVLKKIK